MTFDKNFILETLVTWINDTTMYTINKRYKYAGNDIGSNVGEPSKSYIQGQFYYDEDLNTVYISLILDPNIIWGYKYKALDVYIAIEEHIKRTKSNSLLNGLNIEFLYSEESLLEVHEAKSRCRTEETNLCVYDDTIALWKNIHGYYAFIRDSGVYINDKTNVMYNTGKISFKDYRDEVKELNSRYSALYLNNDSLSLAFDEYKNIYYNYFGRELKVISDNEITKFYLLNVTDYSIIKEIED